MKSHPSLNYLACFLQTAPRPTRYGLSTILCSVALLTLLWTGGAQGAVAVLHDAESETMSVRELMRLDTQLALSMTRTRLDKVAAAGGTLASLAAVTSGELKLLAIYGVGSKLMAEVLIGNQPYVYMRGRSLPVNSKNNVAGYTLGGINGSCIHLVRGDNEHTLCLQPTLRAAR